MLVAHGLRHQPDTLGGIGGTLAHLRFDPRDEQVEVARGQAGEIPLPAAGWLDAEVVPGSRDVWTGTTVSLPPKITRAGTRSALSGGSGSWE